MTTEIDTLEKNISKENISICDIFQNNFSSIINKIEYQIPIFFQMQSDGYKEYLHLIDVHFGTCLIAEKEFLDKLNLDQDMIKFYDNYWRNITKLYLSQIEISTNFLQIYSQLRIATIKSLDEYLHAMNGFYAKMLSQFNSSFENK